MNAITIKKLIEGTGLKGLRLLSDIKFENNKIYNVNIIDNPDSYDWFTAGDFLLTTGYIFKDSIDSQKRLVKELADLNCSGLGIKIKRYWEKVPPIIIEEAKKHNLAIVEIPYNYSLSQITRVINDELLKREDSMLKKYKSIHDAFMQSSLAGGDMNEVVKLASELVNNSVIILDSDFNLLAYYDVNTNPFPLNKNLNLEPREKVFPKEFTETIPRDVDNFTLSIKRKFVTSKNEIICRIIPIAHSRSIYGYIIVWETLHKLESIDYVALESAASTAALERIKAKQIEESKLRLKEDFFSDLIDGKIMSMNAMRNLSKIHGLNTSKNHLVIVLKVYRNNLNNSLSQIQTMINGYFDNRNVKINSIVKDENLVIFMELVANGINNVLSEKTKSIVTGLADEISKYNIDMIFKIGVSNVCSDVLSIGKATNNALKLIAVTEKMANDKNVIFYDDLAVYNLIYDNHQEQAMVDLFKSVLGSLYDHDLINGTEYLKTLESYFEANGNVSLAAKRSFIHRNTFIYRIDKIKEILKNDLNDAEKNFNYIFALKTYKLIKNKLENIK